MARIGVVGAGSIASTHVRAWRRAGAQVESICDINQGLVADFRAKHKIPKTFTDVQDMIQDPTISILDICAPPGTHCGLVCQGLRRKLPVVVEKPLCESTAEAQQMIDVSHETGVTFNVVHSFLFEPLIMKALSIVRAGGIGQVQRTFIFWPQTREDPMTKNPEHWSHKLRGGRFGESLPHMIYLAQAFAGDCEVKDALTIGTAPYSWMKASDALVVLKHEHSHSFFFISFDSPRTMLPIIVEGDKGRLVIKKEYGLCFLDKRQQPFPTWFQRRTEWANHSLRRAYAEIIGQLKLVPYFVIPTMSKGHEIFFSLVLKSLESGTAPPVSVQQAYAVTRTLEEVCIAMDGSI